MLSPSRSLGWRELLLGACATWLVVQNLTILTLIACGRPVGAAAFAALARAMWPVLVPLWVTAAALLVCVTAVAYATRGGIRRDA